MPIGAMRHGFTYQAASGGGGVSTEAVYSLTNLTYNVRSYQIPKINYVGDDSSGQPVYFVGTKDSAGNFVCSLIKRNNDDTISESSVTTLRNTEERFEAQGAAGVDTSGNPVGVTVGTYRVAGVIKTDIFCNQIDLDNLTLGTTYSSLNWTAVQSSAGFAYATYVGNGRFAIGYRNTGIRTAIATVNSSTISISSEIQESSYGDGVYQGLYGVTYQADTDYRWMSANGNGNQHGVAWFAGTTAQGSAYSDTLTVGLSRTEPFEITYGKMITVAGKTGSAQAVASTITWPGSGNPSLTNGSILTFSDAASWVGGFCGASNLVTDTLYVLHNHSSNGWQIRPLTVSGTTISEGSALTVGVTTTNWSTAGEANAACFSNSSQGNIFAALIDDTGSGNPQFYVRDLT